MATRGSAFIPTRVVPLVLTCVLALGALAWFPATARAASQGAISGRIVNGTHNNAPVAGQTVTLQVTTASGSTLDLTTATTDVRGAYRFDNLDIAGTRGYGVTTTFQGGTYGTGLINVATDAPSQNADIKVWDATHDDAHLKISLSTVLFREPKARNGLIGVAAFYTVANTGNQAFIGTVEPQNGRPMGLLRFPLPDGARNLTLGVGFDGAQSAQVGGGFGATATVPPGQTEYAFGFDVPYDGSDYSYTYKALYPTDQVAVLVPPDISTDPRDFEAQGLVTAYGSRYQVLGHGKLDAQKTLDARLYRLPQAGERAYLDPRWLFALAAVLALGLGFLLALYIRTGNLALAFGLVRPSDLAARAPKQAKSAPDEERRLLNDLLDLERKHARGMLDDATFAQRDAEVRGRLRDLLAATEGRAADVVAGQHSATSGTDALASDAAVGKAAGGLRDDGAKIGGAR